MSIMNDQAIIDVLIIEPGQPPRRDGIPNTLEAMQHVVGGYIEHIGSDDHASCWVNEEGRLINLPPNRILIRPDGTIADILRGPILITGHDPDTGEETSLSDEQAERYARLFAGPAVTVA
ncbi:DUF3846 domain-containing protein [Bifidobacterium simiarum]|uniref:DUF3846 domain-containing protein n=1 Tax=Bifidobacterium simiarum TaxID=2045441 RepID=UPI001BDC80BA|nr:DUF3846 domain-containing protein [Bifidobacterium simiarum]MBT1167256.1 DUF3846 domain-containing protein [Bifidobacterium simiarum]